MDLAALSDDVVPGRLKDELAGNFDPSQETYEEYLQRINLERPFNMAEGGQLVAPSVDGSRPGYADDTVRRGPKKKPITSYPLDVQKLIKDYGIKKYNKLNKDKQWRVRGGDKNVGTGSGRVLGDPVTIDGKEYKKVLEGPDKGKYVIKEGTNNPRQFVKKSEIRKTVKANTEKGKQNLQDMYRDRTRLNTLSTKNRNNWIKDWIKNNINKYGVREFDNFQTDLLNNFNKELKNNPKKYPEWMGTVRVSDNLPVIGDIYGKNTIEIDGIKFPRYEKVGERTQKHAYKKLFFKNKLKDKDFRAKVNSYLDWNLTRKFEGGAGSMSKTAALDYGKLAKGFDDDLIYFMGEVLNEKALNPGGGQTGIHDIFKKSIGKKADAYFKKHQGSWARWTNNFYDVAKLAGLDQSQAKALLQKQINDTQKIMKIYNVKKLPWEFMVAQDHIMGLAEAKALGDPKIAAQTLKNLIASTKEQNRYLGQQGFSTKRKALINEFKKAPPNARGPIIEKLNTLSEEFVPGRLKYDVRKDGSLKITNLQPETTLKAKASAYEGITKTFPKNVQKLFTSSMQADLSPRSIAQLSKIHGCGKKQEGGSIMSCLQGKFNANPEKFLQKSAPLAKDNMNLFKWFKNGRKIARGTGIALAWEAAFAPIIAGWGALEGQSGERILNDIAYGIPFIGETEKEEWMKYAGGNELAYKMKQMGELEEQELPYLDQQLEKARKQSAPTREKMPNYVSPKEQYILDDIKEKELKLQGLYNTPEFWEGPAGSYYNESAIQKAYDLEQKTTAQIAADTAKRKKDTFDKLREMKIIADKNWQSQSSYAGGGIASIRRPNAIPPKSGPTPQGLPSMYNRVKRI
jgi:hypothetical protein